MIENNEKTLGVLREMLRKQGDFSLSVRNLKEGTNVVHEAETVERKTRWAQTYILAAHAELSEMLETLPKWKPHRRNLTEQPFDRDAFLEEGVDVFNYLVSALLLHGMEPEELYTIWRGKLDVLQQRQHQEIHAPLTPRDDVVMLDLDGVLADYRQALITFIVGEHNFTDETKHYELEREIGGITPNQYREYKQEFIVSGGLRTVPAFPQAVDIIQQARRLGRLVFVSSREGDKDRKIYRDTLYWLRELVGRTPFTLHFTRNKAEWLANTGVNVRAIVEDEPKTAQRLSAQFPKAHTFVPAWGYNASLEPTRSGHDALVRVPINAVPNELERLTFKDPEAP